eukprot:TRINITY_DN17503_c0_g1_i2.p1 TRINITY_DN17503_c0_g1~~TRINITY_DN17503_c0_g1_i2.p1  ORF type:complete len:390 (-),score=88.96 TRINITY_DN17503_c0_g1_i2:47-1177(-)
MAVFATFRVSNVPLHQNVLTLVEVLQDQLAIDGVHIHPGTFKLGPDKKSQVAEFDLPEQEAYVLRGPLATAQVILGGHTAKLTFQEVEKKNRVGRSRRLRGAGSASGSRASSSGAAGSAGSAGSVGGSAAASDFGHHSASSAVGTPAGLSAAGSTAPRERSPAPMEDNSVPETPTASEKAMKGLSTQSNLEGDEPKSSSNGSVLATLLKASERRRRTVAADKPTVAAEKPQREENASQSSRWIDKPAVPHQKEAGSARVRAAMLQDELERARQEVELQKARAEAAEKERDNARAEAAARERGTQLEAKEPDASLPAPARAQVKMFFSDVGETNVRPVSLPEELAQELAPPSADKEDDFWKSSIREVACDFRLFWWW